MSAEIIPFDFEEQAVRVVMRDGEPWFVAADICRVLDLGNPTETLRRLDDDERDNLSSSEVNGRGRPMNIISESGLYALIFTSRKPEAKRFRKWVTSEVLPSLRKFGRYELPQSAPREDEGDFLGMTFREAELWLQTSREMRLAFGRQVACKVLNRSPLRLLTTDQAGRLCMDPAEGFAALAHLLDHLGAAIADARANGTDALAPEGLRCRSDGLFIGNGARAVFDGTRWAGGAHAAALAALPGVWPVPNPLTLARVGMRGLILPWQLIEGGLGDA